MKKKVLTFREYVNEQESPETTPETTEQGPESEREAKSRIAKTLIKGIFGDVSGVMGGIDTMIELTPEVKEALPYKGCGASEPYPLNKQPLSAKSIEILLKYLDSQGKGDYKRAIKELEEGRSIIMGLRNKIDVKDDSANNDRFTDALYLVPQGAIKKDDKTIASAAEERTKKEAEEKAKAEELAKKAKEDPLARIKQKKKKPEEPKEESPVEIGEKIIPYQITTTPSLAYYGEKPLNPKGTGIKLPGDTLYYLKDHKLQHGQYKMMVEGEPIEVGRYPIGVTKFETYKPAKKSKESTGMHIHRSSTKGKGICVGPWSAGCQVFDDGNEYDDFISKASNQTNNGNRFIYALVELDDIPDNVMEKALKGEDSSSPSIEEPTEPIAQAETGSTEKKKTTRGRIS